MRILIIQLAFLLIFLLIPSCDQNSHEPEIADQIFYLDENSKTGTLIGKIEAGDLDEQQALSFEITEGNTSNAFTLDELSGKLFVNNPTVLDYEKTRSFALKVLVSDNHPREPLESSASISIVLNNLNEFAPEIEEQVFSVNERSPSGTVIGNIIASDPDSGQVLSFKIQSGNKDQVIRLDSLSGELSILDSAWFNNSVNKELVCMVSVSDNDPVKPLNAYAMITIKVLNVSFVTMNISGLVQKGPFIVGSPITITELSQDLKPTGKIFSTQVSDNTGKFDIPDVELESQYILMKADGFYFNERTGELSEAQLSLNSLVDITDLESFNINVITHLKKDRMLELMKAGMGFAEASLQARNEVLGIFGYVSVDQLPPEQMDIARTGEDNAMLLATSLILQGYRTTGEFSEIMSRISLDFKEDGTLDSKSLGSELINGINSANLHDIRQFIEERYDALSTEYEIPDFELYVNQFIEETDFEATNQFIFPEYGSYGQNVLYPDLTSVEHVNLNDIKYSLAVDVPEGRLFEVKILGYGTLYEFGSLINMVNYHESEPLAFSTYTTSSTGLCDGKVEFMASDKNPSGLLTFEYYGDDDTEPFFTKEVKIISDFIPIDSTLIK